MTFQGPGSMAYHLGQERLASPEKIASADDDAIFALFSFGASSVSRGTNIILFVIFHT